MKTTLDLPDELMREIKIRAVHENRRIKDVVADAIRRGLAYQDPSPEGIRRRVQLPLIESTHPASPDEELTPDKAAAVLLADEAASTSGSSDDPV